MTSRKPLNDLNLNQFTGTTQWFRHGLARNVLYTEGVQHLAEEIGAYWLVDKIALAQKAEPAIEAEPFQVWELMVEGSSAVLRCDDGNGRQLLEKLIEFTDFPEPGIKLYFTDGVIMLPGEY